MKRSLAGLFLCTTFIGAPSDAMQKAFVERDDISSSQNQSRVSPYIIDALKAAHADNQIEKIRVRAKSAGSILRKDVFFGDVNRTDMLYNVIVINLYSGSESSETSQSIGLPFATLKIFQQDIAPNVHRSSESVTISPLFKSVSSSESASKKFYFALCSLTISLEKMSSMTSFFSDFAKNCSAQFFIKSDLFLKEIPKGYYIFHGQDGQSWSRDESQDTSTLKTIDDGLDKLNLNDSATG
jgi:hypothetical protein